MTIPTDLAPEIVSTLRTVANAIEQGEPNAGDALAELGRSIAVLQTMSAGSGSASKEGGVSVGDDAPPRETNATRPLPGPGRHDAEAGK